MSDIEQWELVHPSDIYDDSMSRSQGLLTKHGIEIHDDGNIRLHNSNMFSLCVCGESHPDCSNTKQDVEINKQISTIQCVEIYKQPNSQVLVENHDVHGNKISLTNVVDEVVSQVPDYPQQLDVDNLDTKRRTVVKPTLIDKIGEMMSHGDLFIAGFFTVLGWTMVIFVDDIYALEIHG